MSTPITCLVGLGNPTEQYTKTRHNAGFWLLNRLALQQQLQFRSEKKFSSRLSHTTTPRVWLLQPQTYMNRSGQAVQAFMQFYQIPIEQILVVHDEIDLPVGTAKLKRGGGHGGHNGLRDIIQKTGSRDFLRLRLGVGRPEHSSQVVNYVLKSPSRADKQNISEAIDDSINVLPQIIAGDLSQAMNILHSG